MTALEHRWYVFSGLEMAMFVDAGKTVPQKGGVNFSEMNYSGGTGLRARVRGAVVLRMDVARSREGFRWIWSMSRRLAETVLMAARRALPRVARALVLLVVAIGIGRGQAAAQRFYPGRPADARADPAARARIQGGAISVCSSKPCRRRSNVQENGSPQRSPSRPRASTPWATCSTVRGT